MVPRLVTVTIAPDTTAFVESDTVPVISAVGVCAETASASASKTETLFTMLPPAPSVSAGTYANPKDIILEPAAWGRLIACHL